MFLTLLVTCLTFVYTGCEEPKPVVPPDDTEIDSGKDDGQGDSGNTNPDVPEDFTEEPDDPLQIPWGLLSIPWFLRRDIRVYLLMQTVSNR